VVVFEWCLKILQVFKLFICLKISNFDLKCLHGKVGVCNFVVCLYQVNEGNIMLFSMYSCFSGTSGLQVRGSGVQVLLDVVIKLVNCFVISHF